MTNANTEHSKKLRQKTAAARRQKILAEGGRDLRVLLKNEEASMLAKLQEFMDADATAVIVDLIRERYVAVDYL